MCVKLPKETASALRPQIGFVVTNSSHAIRGRRASDLRTLRSSWFPRLRTIELCNALAWTTRSTAATTGITN